MSFQPILRSIVDECGGGLGIALMGPDGIPIDQTLAATASARDFEDELGAAGVEFGRILEEMGKASDALGGGAVSEATVALARFTLILRVVDEESFVVLALRPDGNLGKARYLIRRHLPRLRAEL